MPGSSRKPFPLAIAIVCPCLLCISLGCDSGSRVGPGPGTSNASQTGDSVNKAGGAKSPSPFDVEVKPVATQRDESLRTSDVPQFNNVAAELGLDFTYHNGAKGENLMVEAMGGGAGWLDLDNDGRWDLYLTQGGDPAKPASEQQHSDQLFRNSRSDSFESVAEAAFIDQLGYGQGVAIGDFDNDGFDDVYVTNVGRNVLLRNQGDGTFWEVADEANVGDSRWSSSAAWVDLDRDGDLDLYVCNYADYDPLNPLECKDVNGKQRICHPSDVPPVPDECYINQGNGTFTAEALKRGLFGPGNRGLGVVAADFTNDGLPDLYVANDTTENFLFVNQGDATFREQASLLGCAVDYRGNRQASMGLAAGDFDENGYLDVYSTHYFEESNTLYRNLGPQGFEDVTGVAGLHEPTYLYLGFGTVMQDFNQDGHMDLFVTNGHIDPLEKVYEMPPQMFTYRGERWIDCSRLSGKFFDQPLVGRAVASCDFDGDGDLDLAVAHQNSPVALLQNDSQRGHWLKLQFRGDESNRRGIGVVAIVRAGERVVRQQLCGGTSYAATHQPVLVFGLGQREEPVRLEVLWPSGRAQTIEGVAVDQALMIDERDAS